MNKFTFINLAMISMAAATPAWSASEENAQAYLDRVVEITDFDELSVATAEQVMNSWQSMGITFSDGNRDEAQKILSDLFVDLLPQTIQQSAPVVAEVYTDEEIQAALEFSQTPEGESFMSKSGIYGTQSMAETAAATEQAIMQVMPEIMSLANQ